MQASAPELMDEILARAVDEIVFRVIGMFDSMTGADGQVWGDIPLTGADFVAFYVDLGARGVLGHLEVIDAAVGSNHAEELRREYDRQFAKMVTAADSLNAGALLGEMP